MKTLYLIGSGIGDPELITLKALKIIQQADVILYDSLANEEILTYSTHSLKLFVGKRKGFKPFSQEMINESIIELSKRYTKIVRLKGGDPFVFGRGFEEMEYARQHGLHVEYIPGISSVVAAAGCASIPVTHRDLARSFMCITATCSDGSLSEDIRFAASNSCTAVILMGLSQLESIVEIYKALNKHSLPVAVIQNASLPNQQVVSGSVHSIVELCKTHDIGSPATLIFGEVAKFAVTSVSKEVNSRIAFSAIEAHHLLSTISFNQSR